MHLYTIYSILYSTLKNPLPFEECLPEEAAPAGGGLCEAMRIGDFPSNSTDIYTSDAWPRRLSLSPAKALKTGS